MDKRITGALICDGALAGSDGPDGPTIRWVGMANCTIAGVASLPDRVHFQCRQTVLGSVVDFATEANSAIARRTTSPAMMMTRICHITLAVLYNPDAAANPAGCLPTERRRILGAQ